MIDRTNGCEGVEAWPIARWASLGVLILTAIGAACALWRLAVGSAPRVHRLADGTLASFAEGTHLMPAHAFPARREVWLGGIALLKVPAERRPMTIRTRLMRIEVVKPSTLLVTARPRGPGEEVDVLTGEVIVTKSYPSAYRAADDLRAGEMSMVNRTIDLMERETIGEHSIAKMRVWAKTLR